MQHVFLTFFTPGPVPAYSSDCRKQFPEQCLVLTGDRIEAQAETFRESGIGLYTEVTGGNFPHYTNQPQKMKTDRVPTSFVIPWECVTALIP